MCLPAANLSNANIEHRWSISKSANLIQHVQNRKLINVYILDMVIFCDGGIFIMEVSPKYMLYVHFIINSEVS